MELHENLYALGQRLGREVFDDPDSFRGALDDFLDEESATTGDINLLVDAVRLGAFASMTSMLDSGAQVTAAVDEAGSRLARDRGSADVAGAQWACAVLGFAIGKVGDAEVRRYRTQHATPLPPRQPLPPTQFPGQQQPPGPVPPTRYPGAPPTGAAPPPTAQPMYAPAPPPPQPPQSWPGHPALPPEPKRRTWPLVVATVVAIALIAGGIVALVVTRDDDDVQSGSGNDNESETVDERPTDISAVTERYSGLAGDVGAVVDECEADDPSDGATELLTCTFPEGTLELATYQSAEDLEAARATTVTTNPGTLFSENGPGTFYAEDAGSAVGESDTSMLYWDSAETLQSGRFVASAGTDTVEQLDDLKEQFDAVDAPVAYPEKPEDEALVELATEFIALEKCSRIPTIQDGEVEESICTGPKGIFIFMGVFETEADFKDYRRQALREGSNQGYPLSNWNFDGGAREGAAAEYVNSSGTAVRYWDRDDCRCYMEANLDSGNLKVVENWWVNA